MSLLIIKTDDADLTKVQQNVKKECDDIRAQLPSSKTPSTTIGADYSVKLTDVLVLANAPANINVTLPAAATCSGERFTIKNLASAASVFLRGFYKNSSFETIDLQQKYELPSNTAATCQSDGKAWWIV